MADALTLPFVMNGSREVLLTGAAHLERQIVALEAAASSNPGLAFDLAKTLLESACKTVLSERACQYDGGWDLPKLLKETLSQLQLVPDKLGSEADVSDSLRKTAGGLQTTIQGICELRNTHGFASHGKDPTFQELESVQALLVARAADAIVSFVFRVHQGYERRQSPASLAYNDHPKFNEYVDECHEPVQVFKEDFAPSRILFELAPEPYRVYLTEFQQEEKGSGDITTSEVAP
jgi:hypothetical protein